MNWVKRVQTTIYGETKKEPSIYEFNDRDIDSLIPDRKLGNGYDDYFNGDIYETPPSKNAQEWEVNSYVFPEVYATSPD